MNEKKHDAQQSEVRHSHLAELPVEEFGQMETYHEQYRCGSKEIEIERLCGRLFPQDRTACPDRNWCRILCYIGWILRWHADGIGVENPG